MREGRKQFTLCMVCSGGGVLLGMKKRGFGEGRWNGFGGKVGSEETLEQAAIRELKEEAEIKPISMYKIGIIDFSFQDNPEILEVHIFRVDDYVGEPRETEEMRPQWFKIDEIPFSQMWPDDEHWFPYLLGGNLFKGRFLFDNPSDAEHSARIITYTLREVDSLQG